MAVNSKQKGNQWERDIANYLSKRFKDYLGVEQGFWRRSDSGSRFGGSNQHRKDTHLEEHQGYGDIVCPHDFRWTIEAKHYKEPLSLNAIIKQDSKQLDKWLEQAEQDAKNAGKEPMLIVKYNRCEPFVMVKENDMMYAAGLFRYRHGYCGNDFWAKPLDDFFNVNMNDNYYFGTTVLTTDVDATCSATEPTTWCSISVTNNGEAIFIPSAWPVEFKGEQ